MELIVQHEKKWVRLALNLGLWTFLAFVFTSFIYLDYLIQNRSVSMSRLLLHQLGTWYVFGVLSPFVLALVNRVAPNRRAWFSAGLIYLAASVAFSVLHSCLVRIRELPQFFASPNVELNLLLYYRFNIFIFLAILGFAYLSRYTKEQREKEISTAKLRGELAQAKLEQLQAQFRPHFLFNTLHSIASEMYDDLDTAHEMITRLGDLLRRAFEKTEQHEITLEEETHFLRGYLEIQKMRFRDRLNFKFEVPQEVRNALIPCLILQPIFENAIKYAIEPYATEGRIDMRACRKNSKLQILIQDSGPGIVGDSNLLPAGVGLSNCKARLEQLYGSRHKLDITSANGGGLVVTLEIPYRTVQSNGDDDK